jgi:lysophospholipase L1-like esterase
MQSKHLATAVKCFAVAMTVVICFFGVISTATAQSNSRILVFGDSNTWGWIPRVEGFPTTRLSDNDRYTGVISRKLGSGVTVVVDGLVGRTTNVARAEAVGTIPGEKFNGNSQLQAAIASQGPFDAVVVMLGTNDLSAGIERTPNQTASATLELAQTVKNASNLAFSSYRAPKVLIVAPPPYGDTSRTPLTGLFKVGEQPSKQLGSAIVEAANRSRVPVFDAGTVLPQVNGIDGVHMTKRDHTVLGRALASEIRKVLNSR